MVEDFEIIEPGDQYEGKPSEGYSHSNLVMIASRKVIENSAKEMREGYWNTKFDRLGNAHRVWIPDSRQEFKEAVNTLRMIMERDLDEEAEKGLQKIDDELKEKYQKFCELEEAEWKTAPIQLKINWQKKGSYFRKNFLSKELPYAFEYVEEEIKASRRIVKCIGKLIKRLYDYQEVSYEA